MSRRTTGWLFVLGQGVLLVALVVIPTAGHWPRPAWLLLVSGLLTIAGLGVVVLGASHLGDALTSTPEPKGAATLRTDGLYRFVRHPIYSGVLVIVVGLVLRSGSAITLAVAVVTLAFFNAKAAWEEARLAERYPGYADYASTTPRFVPGPRRRSERSVSP